MVFLFLNVKAFFSRGACDLQFYVFYILMTYSISKDKPLTSIDVLDGYPSLLTLDFLPEI